ncbi:MAG: basic amino acid ABC transporter substrate-binding protein [Bacillota bacterium]
MKKYAWLAVILVVILAAGMALAAKPVLRVGTDATYEPFETIDKNGNFVGFDMDFIRLVADAAGMELKLMNVGWDGIIPGLNNGNYDCLISAMTITAERKKQINFTTPYFSIQQAIVVKKDSPVKGPDDLIGKTISVQNGTTGDLYASKIKDVKMKRFDTNPQAIQELLNNNADASVMDDMVAFNAVKKTPGLKIIQIKNAEKENYGIGVKKGNDALLAKLNKAIATLQKNGKLAVLVAKYKSAE